MPTTKGAATPKKSTSVRIISIVLRSAAVVAPDITAAGLEAAFRHSRRFPVPERERRWLAGAERDTFESGGRGLPIWSWGRGPTVLLVHGWHDRDDHEVPWRDGSRIAAAWPGSTLVTTRGLGHRRPLRDPDVVSRTVEFLSGDASDRSAP